MKQEFYRKLEWEVERIYGLPVDKYRSGASPSFLTISHEQVETWPKNHLHGKKLNIYIQVKLTNIIEDFEDYGIIIYDQIVSLDDDDLEIEVHKTIKRVKLKIIDEVKQYLKEELYEEYSSR